MDLYLVHLSIMHIQAEEYSLSLTESFTAAAGHIACKPGACGGSGKTGRMQRASFDVMNKYFGISARCRWQALRTGTLVHGCTPGEAAMDEEGLQTMRNLGRNMAWMLKCLEAGKEQGISLPKTERGNQTNFIR